MHNCTHFIIDRQISSKFIKNANVSKMLCSDKFNRIFLHRQIGYMLVSKMAKFGPANFKGGRVRAKTDYIERSGSNDFWGKICSLFSWNSNDSTRSGSRCKFREIADRDIFVVYFRSLFSRKSTDLALSLLSSHWSARRTSNQWDCSIGVLALCWRRVALVNIVVLRKTNEDDQKKEKNLKNSKSYLN